LTEYTTDTFLNISCFRTPRDKHKCADHIMISYDYFKSLKKVTENGTELLTSLQHFLTSLNL